MFSEIRLNILVVLLCVPIMPQIHGVKLEGTERAVCGVTDHMRENWAIWFISKDINKDGVLSVKDRDMARERFTAAFRLSPEDKAEKINIMNFWWKNDLLQGNISNKISKDEFIQYLSKRYLEDKHFRDNALVFQQILAEMLDVDEDGSISKSEFLAFYKALKFKNKKVIEEFFYAYKPIEDKVPKKQMTRAWADFIAGSHKTTNFIRKYMIKILGLQDQFAY